MKTKNFKLLVNKLPTFKYLWEMYFYSSLLTVNRKSWRIANLNFITPVEVHKDQKTFTFTWFDRSITIKLYNLNSVNYTTTLDGDIFVRVPYTVIENNLLHELSIIHDKELYHVLESEIDFYLHIFKRRLLHLNIII